MKRILIISNLDPGGSERRAVTIACELKNREYDVTVVSCSSAHFYIGLLEEQSISVHQILVNKWLRMFTFWRFVSKHHYDAVISFTKGANFINCICNCGKKNTKIIIGEGGSSEDYFKRLRSKVFYLTYRFADVLVCNSYNANNMWKRHRPQYSRIITTIYNPVSLQPVTSSYFPRRENKLHIIVVASYQYIKNPVGLIEALALFSDEDKQKLKIDWYGGKRTFEGNEFVYDKVQTLIRRHQLEEVFSFYDETLDIHSRMNEADVVALLSKLEGLPNAICEGMTIGKPILMSRMSDYDVLVDPSNGWLCDWDSPGTIQEALLKAVNTSIDDLLKMGKASQEKAKHLFNKECIIQQWINLFETPKTHL